jgi:transposase-like protein
VTASRATSVFAGFRFPPEVISLAVHGYLRYGLSHRDVEELLAERGITVDHVSVFRWVQRFTLEFFEAAKPVPLENRILALTWAFSILRRLAHTR